MLLYISRFGDIVKLGIPTVIPKELVITDENFQIEKHIDMEKLLIKAFAYSKWS